MVRVRAPTAGDQQAFIAAVRRSRALHGRWITAPSNAQEFRVYLQRVSAESHRGFLVVRRADRELVGVINLSHIIRGALQSAFVGYYAFAPFARQGYMREGLMQVVRYAFGERKLHRIEANVQPGNLASQRLLRSCGFRKEGFSPRYLKLRGRWRDHERWAVLRENFERHARPERKRQGQGGKPARAADYLRKSQSTKVRKTLTSRQVTKGK